MLLPNMTAAQHTMNTSNTGDYTEGNVSSTRAGSMDASAAANSLTDNDIAQQNNAQQHGLTGLPRESNIHRECVLCAYHGNLAVVNKQILNYIEDAISHVDKREICAQVVQELQSNGMSTTTEDVMEHIEKHMINKHVIMSNIVHDLIDIARASKHSCILTSEETGQPAVDPKYASIYFKAVDQLGSILRSEAYKPNKNTG